MMLIICDNNPQKAVDYLAEHTNKQFVFKQLLELGQLICSADISDEFKPVNQGQELQKWILANSAWTADFFEKLFDWCVFNGHIKMSYETICKLEHIYETIRYFARCKLSKNTIKTAVFRYKKGYKTDIPTNTLLPIDKCCEEYKKYLDWKMR